MIRLMSSLSSVVSIAPSLNEYRLFQPSFAFVLQQPTAMRREPEHTAPPLWRTRHARDAFDLFENEPRQNQSVSAENDIQ
jgi:hypothetical protein